VPGQDLVDSVHHATVRLETEDGTAAPQALWLVLDREEALLLAEALRFYFEEDPVDPGWHHHIGEEDGAFTLAIEAPGRSPS